MTTDLREPTVDAQADPALTTQPEENGNGDNASVEDTSIQPSEQNGNGDDQLGPNNLPPELEKTRKELLRDYHAKLRVVNDDKLRFESEFSSAKTKADTLGNLFQQDWFKRAMEEERARRNGTVTEALTDEQFEAVKNDKTAFMKLVSGLAERMVTNKVEPVISNHQENLENIQLEREFESAKSRFKDFSSLNEQGSLDPYLERGFDFETSYKLYKADNMNEKDIDAKAAEKARELLDQSRQGAISKGGLTKASGSRVLEASNFDDAFDQVWAAVQRGEKDVKVNRKK